MTRNAKVIQVIETESVIGEGEPESPVRSLIQYWDFQGNCLAQKDSWFEQELQKRGLGPKAVSQ